MASEKNNQIPEEISEEVPVVSAETPVVPVKKPAKFVPPAMNFNRGAMKFNPPNKQRPGHHAGRGR